MSKYDMFHVVYVDHKYGIQKTRGEICRHCSVSEDKFVRGISESENFEPRKFCSERYSPGLRLREIIERLV